MGVGFGGGLFNYGTLTLANSTVSGNKAHNDGGGVHSYFYAGRLTVTNSTISSNSAGTDGGGISNGSLLSLTNSTISCNSSGTGRGGVFTGGGGVQNNGTLTVISSTISNNTASYGGGIHNHDSSKCTVTNSTISGNTATGNGDNDFVLVAISGGGISNIGLLTVTNSTISGNAAAVGVGGGVMNYFSSVTPSSATLNRALISGNSAPRGREVFEDTSDGNADSTAANFNLFGHKGETNAQAFVGFTPSGTDINATSNGNKPTALAKILNTTLANNGGPTRTNALVTGSPAIDAINDGTCPPPAMDQRGVSRPRDGNRDGGAACDIGAVEAPGPTAS